MTDTQTRQGGSKSFLVQRVKVVCTRSVGDEKSTAKKNSVVVCLWLVVNSKTKMSNVFQIEDEEKFNALLSDSKKQGSTMVLFFWADWHPPCKQMLAVMTELAKEKNNLTYVQIEAEKFPDLSEQYPVQSVPTFVVLKGGEVVDTLEGASAPKLVQLIGKHNSGAVKAAVGATVSPEEEKKTLDVRLAQLIRAAPVMLFMKGSPDAPKCGFSRTITGLLKDEKVKFGYFDILTDDSVREGLKTYSNWKTYPQLYIKGELVGGVDVVKELIAEGELKDMVPQESQEEDLDARLKELINQQRVMLFMKGNPDAPQCGFSRTMVGLLRDAGFSSFGHFDILLDNAVREGLKTYSNWKTYPQLYVDGELLGGLDVVKELQESGELADYVTKK